MCENDRRKFFDTALSVPQHVESTVTPQCIADAQQTSGRTVSSIHHVVLHLVQGLLSGYMRVTNTRPVRVTVAARCFRAVQRDQVNDERAIHSYLVTQVPPNTSFDAHGDDWLETPARDDQDLLEHEHIQGHLSAVVHQSVAVNLLQILRT